MKITFNPSTVAALTTPPNNKDITFDLRGRNIFARGVKFYGTDTNTWRDIKINNVSIGSHTLDLRNGSNTTLTNTNGVVTINSTWRPVVDNLTSDSTTSSLSAKQGKVLKALIDGKSNSDHNHDGRYLKLTGGTMASNALITFADSGSWDTSKKPQGARGGLYWTGQSDYAKLYAEETVVDNLDLVIQFGDDNSNGLSIRNKANTQTSYISAGGVITTGTFKGNLDWSYITNKPASYTPSAHTHAWNSLTHSSTTENQAILTNGKANGWKLYTLNISRWDNAANNAHSHANKSVLDGITSALVNSWNTAYNFVSNITGTDTDKVINKWEEIVNFLAGITEDNKLNTLLNSKLSVYELADNTNVGTIKNNGIYYSTTDASSGTLINSPFNTGFAFINMTSYDGGDDLRRSRLAFNAFGEIKVSDDRDQANTAETWYNVLTSKNSGINGSTIKLNGTSITVYSSGTADGRYVKKSGDTMSGVLTIDTTNFGALTIKRNDDANGASIQFRGKSSVYGYIGLNNSTKDKQFLRWSSDTSRVYTILDTSSTYISNGKGVINGTTITQVDNATNSTNSTNARKLVNWYSARPTSLNAQFGDGSLRIFYATSSTTEGKPAEDSHILHLAWDNTGGWDAQLAVHARSGKVSTRAQNGGTWQPWKTLAFANEIPTSLKNPYALTISLNGTSQGPYDGSAAKNINITPGSIGAAVSNHSHDYLVVNSADDKSFNSAYHNFQVLYAGGGNGITGKPANVDAFGLFKFRAASGWSGQMLLANGGSLYIRSSEDAKMTNTLAWKTILDSSNYSGILDSRYYTESEVNSLLDAKLNRQNLSYGTWNPRGYHLAADYHYNGGDLSISESGGKIHVSVDGYFWQNEGQYRVLDTSDVAGLKSNLTVHQYLLATDAAWYPLIWGGNSHNNTSDSTGAVYKSYDKLSWQTSSQTLYATNIQTNNIKNLSIGGGIYWNPYVESASDGSDAASITLVRSGVAGGTTLVLSQMNDTNDTIQFKTNTAARLYHNSYPILTTQNTYVSNNKGYINGTEITQVNNSDTLDNWHKDNIQWTGYITSSSNSLSSYWFKMYQITVTGYQYNDITITFLVSEGYSKHFSIFHLKIRQNGTNHSGNYNLRVELRELVGNLRDKVVAYYNNSTGDVQLWGNPNGLYNTMNYTVLKKTTRIATDSLSLGILTAQSFSSVQTPPSTGYTRVTMARVGSVSYSDSTGSVHWNNVTNKPSTFNPAAHTHTVFKNNLMIKGTNGISDSASIHLGIGDSDTGFKWISDGVCQIYANNAAVGQWTSGGMDWFRNPTVNGNKVWNAGNDGSGSGLDADTLDGYHETKFFRHRGNTNKNESPLKYTGGTLEYYGNLPSGMNNVYNWGGSLVSGGEITSLQFYYPDPANDKSIYARTFWDNNDSGWHKLAFTDSKVADSDKLDGIHANGLLTALSNSNNGISITVGGTTKSISNINVNYAASAGNANTLDGIDSTRFLRQVVVPNNTENDFNTFSNMTLTGRIDPTTGASLKNAPWSGSGPAGGYGVLTYLFNGSGYGTQMAWGYSDNRIYIRNRYRGGSGVGPVWRTSWDTLALTSDIPTVTNYYWANVKISASSSTTTSPTVHTLTATRVCAGHNPGIDNSISCSNWFRSSGNTGWYNTTYQGGWYMSDTSWIRAHNGVGIYTSGQIYSSSSIRMSNILLEHTDEINNSANGGIYLNFRNSGNVSLCYGGGNVGIGTTTPSYKLDVNGQMRASGFHHSSVNSDNYILLAGGGYKSFGGDDSTPIFLGCLDLYRGDDGTISSSFYCLGYSVPFTYTIGGNYCKIVIPNTTRLSFYIIAATASVNYSGGGMDTWTGYHRGSGAWWLHCYAFGWNEVRVKGFCQANKNNDSWWGGNPLWNNEYGANRITVCIFGHVKYK